MKTYKVDGYDHKTLYKLLIGSVIPRPIAFVTSLNEQGVINAAPFSYFNVVSSKPPMIMISVNRNDKGLKDTAQNIILQKEYVVHTVDEAILDAVNQTSESLPHDVSELTKTTLTTVNSQSIHTPGIKESKVRFECTLFKHVELPSADIFIGEVRVIHVNEGLLTNGRINASMLNPVARLAGSNYTTLGKIIKKERPD